MNHAENIKKQQQKNVTIYRPTSDVPFNRLAGHFVNDINIIAGNWMRRLVTVDPNESCVDRTIVVDEIHVEFIRKNVALWMLVLGY